MQSEATSEYIKAPHGFREWIFIFILCATQLFTQGALGYILIPLRQVGETFHQVGHEQAAYKNWHVAALSLTVGSFILVAGRLGDIYGSKTILVFGWVWFGLWSIICGCSAFTSSPIFFDVSRGFQGIGPALLLPNALAIAGRTYPYGMKKNIIFSMIAMSAPLGCAVAGLIGSAFAEFLWWPWAAWMSGIGCLIVGFAAHLTVPQYRIPASEEGKIQFDWLGAIFGVGGLILLNVSWNQAPIDGWSTPYVYILLILGFIFLGLFAWQEKRAVQPIVDISIFNGRVVGVLLVTALGWSSFGIWFYYLFQFLQNLRNLSSLQSGLQFVPGALSGMIAPFFVAWAVAKLPTSSLLVISSIGFFIGSLLLALAPVEQSYWLNTFWSFIIMPVGMDISFPASALFISNAVSIEHQGISASLVNTVINYSIALGLGIGGTVEIEIHPESLLEGYKAAEYTAVGLAASAVILSLILAALSRWEEGEKSKA